MDMSDVRLPIIACAPVNNTRLLLLIKNNPRVRALLPEPSILHIRTVCQKCVEDVWIGPKQREVAEADVGTVLCYPCAVLAAEAADFDMTNLPTRVLNPGIDKTPRRPR